MENKELANIDYTKSSLEEEYYRCTFKNCNFSGIRIGKVLFEQCRFEHCNLSLVMASNTSWQEVTFYECKMTGTNLAASNGFSLSFTFEGCILSYAIFQELKLQGTHFTKCILQEAEFSGANLSGAVFKECDLSRTVFQHTNLEGADFTTALYYSINPNLNRVRKARFSRFGLEGLLGSFGIEIVS